MEEEHTTRLLGWLPNLEARIVFLIGFFIKVS
jgi:hypothetical protein